MTTIISQTAATSWTTWFRRAATSIAKLAVWKRNAVANAPDLERDMRLYAVELERQQSLNRLSAGSYLGTID